MRATFRWGPAMSDPKEKSVNKHIDKAISEALKQSGDQPFDMRLKAIQVAINWEKAQHAIRGDEEFDPDAIGGLGST